MIMNHRYSIGIVPSLVGIKVFVYDHESIEMKEFSGNLFDVLAFINKNANLKESIAVLENIDMISVKFILWNSLKDNIIRMMKYFKWKRRPTRHIPDDQYDYPELQSDFFQILKSHGEMVSKQTVQKIITEAFKMRDVLVIGCDGTPVEEKVKQPIRFDSKIPSSRPGGPNDNTFVIKSNL